MRLLLTLLVAGTLAGSLSFAIPARAQTFSTTVWQLEQLPPETGFTPSSRYTIEFLSGGKVAVEADCNRASGIWDADSGSSGVIDITITLTAVAACPTPSKESTFLDRLDAANQFEITDGGNTMILRDDGTEILVLTSV